MPERIRHFIVLLNILLLAGLTSGLASAQGFINSSAYVKIAPGTNVIITGATGHYINSGTGVLELGGSLELQGNWVNNGSTAVCIPGTGTLTDGTITFTGANAQSIGGTAASTLENLTVNKTVGSTLSLAINNTNVEGNLRVQSGIMNANTYLMYVARNFTNTSVFNAGTGTLVFDGTVAQNISPGGATFYNMTVLNSTAGATDLNATQPIVITGNSTFTDGVLYYTGTGSLTYNNGATSNQGATGSFVNGLITKIGINAFTFPTGDVVGANAVWAPLGISAPAAASTITNEYFFTTSPNNWNPIDMCNPAVLDHTSGVEYWQLNRSAGAGAYPNVTLYWKNAVRSGITNLPDLVVAHYEPCAGPLKWASMGGAAIDDGGGTGHITNSIAFTSYSPVTFGTRVNSNPLPVELLEFEAGCENQEVWLRWSTASESNNDYFKIERSENGTSWSFLSSIPGAGNSNTIKTYLYQDADPLSAQAYYRLSQIDYDGSVTTYPAVVAQCNEEGTADYLMLYPNPATEQVQLLINVAAETTSHLVITDMLGQQILVQDLALQAGSNTFSLDIRQLAEAYYYISVVTPSQIFPVQKLLIHK